jgi:hypothetical protein
MERAFPRNHDVGRLPLTIPSLRDGPLPLPEGRGNRARALHPIALIRARGGGSLKRREAGKVRLSFIRDTCV